jgi:multidrug efflux system membrane fusion protein
VRLRIERGAVTVPASAVQHGPDGLYVYIVTDDHTALRQDVNIGYEGEGQVVVTSGLKGGEQVIVSGQVRVNAGTKVDPTPLGAG